jgi:hypothetical protein
MNQVNILIIHIHKIINNILKWIYLIPPIMIILIIHKINLIINNKMITENNNIISKMFLIINLMIMVEDRDNIHNHINNNNNNNNSHYKYKIYLIIIMMIIMVEVKLNKYKLLNKNNKLNKILFNKINLNYLNNSKIIFQ